MKYKASEIAKFLNTELIGNDIDIYKVSAIDELESNSLSFISKYGFKEDITKGALIIVRDDYEIDKNSKNSYIITVNPRLFFAKVVNEFFAPKKEIAISKSAKIGKNVILGESIFIGENVVIEDKVNIGDNTIIEHNAVILRGSKIGSNCYISSGVIIGNDGLGTIRDENNNLIAIRHIGNVIIEDFVELGANTTTGRGTINNTIIKKYTKIGPQVNIGHNSYIDENCEIAGRAHLSGSVNIGKNCFIGANCSIKDGIKIGNNVTIGIGAVIIKDVVDNKKVMGLEALELRKIAKIKKNIDYK